VAVFDMQRSGNVWQLAGSLDAESGRALLSEITRAGADVCIDGSGLQRIDGAGLTALAVARLRCRADGRAFALTEVASDASRELRVGTQLLELFAPRRSDAHEDGSSAVHEPVARPDARARRVHHFHFHRRHDGTTR
jgi:anti-anti-sigma regulatory factor